MFPWLTIILPVKLSLQSQPPCVKFFGNSFSEPIRTAGIFFARQAPAVPWTCKTQRASFSRNSRRDHNTVAIAAFIGNLSQLNTGRTCIFKTLETKWPRRWPCCWSCFTSKRALVLTCKARRVMLSPRLLPADFFRCLSRLLQTSSLPSVFVQHCAFQWKALSCPRGPRRLVDDDDAPCEPRTASRTDNVALLRKANSAQTFC